MSLPNRYHPQRLADVVGQPAVVRQLAAFARAPYPAAFLFHGPTGTGKTSAAICLAAELEFLSNGAPIYSGSLVADEVRNAIRKAKGEKP